MLASVVLVLAQLVCASHFHNPVGARASLCRDCLRQGPDTDRNRDAIRGTAKLAGSSATPRSRAQRLVTNDRRSKYTFTEKALQELPEGNNTALDQVLLQAPGVAQDGYGQIHVRGDHANLQYRLNGILIPEGVGGFAQILTCPSSKPDPHRLVGDFERAAIGCGHDDAVR